MTAPIEVTAAIIVHQGKILLARRAPHKHLGGYWEFPGGKIEEGETPERCLMREIQEELGVVVQVKKFFMENLHHCEKNSILLKSFLCELTSSFEFQHHEHDQIAWVEKEEMENYQMAPADIPIIEALQQGQLPPLKPSVHE